MLSAEGLAASDDKIKAIQQLPEPKTVKELRQALGLINYQRKFIPNAARMLAPLNALLKGKVTNAMPISFTSEAKSAFCDIKRILADTTYLAHPCADADLSLHTNASNVVLGAILEQTVAGKIEVLGYFSKTLNDTQRRYSTYDLELLAMHSAVKYFGYMLMDKSFTIFTDNKSLVNTFLKPSANHTSKKYDSSLICPNLIVKSSINLALTIKLLIAFHGWLFTTSLKKMICLLHFQRLLLLNNFTSPVMHFLSHLIPPFKLNK